MKPFTHTEADITIISAIIMLVASIISYHIFHI
jgi:hypothetical protein